MGTLYILRGRLGLHVTLSGAVAIELAIIHNFTWHYLVTWRERIQRHHLADYLKRLVHYNIVTASIDLLVNLSILTILVKYYNVYYLYANLVGMMACPIFKFLANEFIIFKYKIAHHSENE